MEEFTLLEPHRIPPADERRLRCDPVVTFLSKTKVGRDTTSLSDPIIYTLKRATTARHESNPKILDRNCGHCGRCWGAFRSYHSRARRTSKHWTSLSSQSFYIRIYIFQPASPRNLQRTAIQVCCRHSADS